MYKLSSRQNTNFKSFAILSVALIAILGCNKMDNAATNVSKGTEKLTTEDWGQLPDGTIVKAVNIENSNGIKARIVTYGATLQSLQMPDKSGNIDDIVIGYDDLKSYVEFPQYLGVTVGRYANRIREGKFSIDGVNYQLDRNNDKNALHGGKQGFDKRNWELVSANSENGVAKVVMKLKSQDMDQGYPGNLDVKITYILDKNNDLRIDYEATTDKATIVNLTNHSLFNMGGIKSGRSALDAKLQIEADQYTPVDDTLIPTGELKPVAGSPFDFTKPAIIGSKVRDANDPQILIGLGIDHNYVIRGGVTAEPKLAVTIKDEFSGRKMEILTTEPGIQMYTGNFLDGKIKGKNGWVTRMGDAVAFEAQKFPNSPNEPKFPSARLDKGQVYKQTTIHRLSIEK